MIVRGRGIPIIPEITETNFPMHGNHRDTLAH
jgi:hypothetical protein